MRYTDLIFDLYGTLVDIHTEEDAQVWEKTAIYFGFYGADYRGETLEAAFHRELSRRKAQVGQDYECFPDIPLDQVMGALFRQCGVETQAEELGFHAAQLMRILSMDYIRLYPRVKESLEMLRSQGFRLWLLSNAQRAFTAYELRALGLETAFDGIYISSDYGFRKPDARFFRALLEEHQLDPARCLMIGNDRQTDIAGAANLGIDTFYMHTNLTPADQEPADPERFPGKSREGVYEFEGDNWEEIGPVLMELCS